jgi:hypothetical protein
MHRFRRRTFARRYSKPSIASRAVYRVPCDLMYPLISARLGKPCVLESPRGLMRSQRTEGSTRALKDQFDLFTDT